MKNRIKKYKTRSETVEAPAGYIPFRYLLAGTVTVDFASQMIFDSPEELLEYKKKLHAEAAAAKKDY